MSSHPLWKCHGSFFRPDAPGHIESVKATEKIRRDEQKQQNLNVWVVDHPRTSKWLMVTMVIVSPLSRVVGPLPNGLNGL